MYAGHLDLTQPLVWTVDDALPRDVCDAYARRLREGAAEVAPIVGHHGAGGRPRGSQQHPRDVGRRGRGQRAARARRAACPAVLSGLKLAGANPRLRIYRYGPGERHGVHWDTVVELPRGIRSLLTLVFYLNDGFEGGDTDFPELSRRISLAPGRALLFQHRILHTATEVLAGEKLVLRTDVLYAPASSEKR